MEIDKLKGLFEGGNFPNAQINILTGNGIHISYKSSEEKKGEAEPASKDAIMDYVKRLMPVVREALRALYARRAHENECEISGREYPES